MYKELLIILLYQAIAQLSLHFASDLASLENFYFIL